MRLTSAVRASGGSVVLIDRILWEVVPGVDVIAQLTKLGELKAAGVPTGAEFTIARA